MPDAGVTDTVDARSRRVDGTLILWWTLPVVAVITDLGVHPVPRLHHRCRRHWFHEQVMRFYRDLANLSHIRGSMILFSWFCVGLVPCWS